ncbi:E3 ubiquitin-protein ligase TRIM39 [Pygocentrus nattereri]|uniref:Bloodthirsty-related gene family, member 1 n=1 Tax=Pygocentrus nattereri TaxID=42514 RepID=A0A3B4CLD0_PYGNA|nr:E3 ubiquitin-protein ligase TRIM39 [Pygocentrus nattereri]
MSIPVDFLSEEQFSCSICLDVFNNPVSTPCGHSFCLACITLYWDSRSKACICPLCKESFRKRPELHTNHTLKEITEQFKRMAETGGAVANTQAPSNSEQRPSAPPRPGELPGGLLTEMKTRFQRTSSSGNLLASPPPYEACQRRFSTSTGVSTGGSCGPPCARHGLCLDMFCRNDQTCVCAMCVEGEHHGHSVIPAKREMNIKKSQLGIIGTELQVLITAREKKIEEIQTSLADIQANAQQEAEVTVSMFRILLSTMEKCQAELLEVVQIGRRAAELRAQALVRDIQQEIDELTKRNCALTELTQATDYISFFKTYSSLCSVPQVKNWTEVTLTPDPTAGAVLRNATQMVESLQEELKRLPQLCLQTPTDAPAKYYPKVRNVQEYILDVTLDQDSAHPRLVISEDCKQVYCSERYHAVVDTPERFDRVVCVLGRQGFNSGRHYWEVQVGGKTDWDLGVAKRSINRKGKISVSPANGYWFLSLRDNKEYAFRSDPPTPIALNQKPQKIGIYVDFEKGQVSFYNVDAKILIFTYMDIFTDILHPFFSPCTNKSGRNVEPLIICPINPAS